LALRDGNENDVFVGHQSMPLQVQAQRGIRGSPGPSAGHDLAFKVLRRLDIRSDHNRVVQFVRLNREHADIDAAYACPDRRSRTGREELDGIRCERGDRIHAAAKIDRLQIDAVFCK
jgi:hypothetical protein